VLTALQQSTGILQAKSPQDLTEFRSVITAACDQVANASGGVKDTETAAIAKVKSALGA
jgi:tellurite resistance protein